jgi:arsenate reductase-like glutaredoxin family protein|nr:MAG TPA: minor tail protein Z [Caudoviricetes sp.]
MNLEITVLTDELLEYARQRLGEMHKKAPMAVRTAINKTAKEAKKKNDKLTKSRYTAKGDINALQFTKATTSNLRAILKDKGKNISITHFKNYTGKSFISTIINNQNGRKRLNKYGNKAFFYNTIFVREGKSRLPIQKMMSISSPVMHGNKGTWGEMDDETLQKLFENVGKEVERMLNK